MKKIAFLFVLPVLLFSCGEEEQDNDTPKVHHEEVADNTISTDFNTNNFGSQTEVNLLKELKICNPNAADDSDRINAGCSPKLFKFFPLTKKTSLNDGFMLLIKAGVNGFPIRRFLIFERENGQLIKLNGFNGNLIERRPAASGYDDLVIRFPENAEGSLIYFNCLFSWENGKYEYKYCEEIDENGPARIKAEFRDSMAVEIKKVLNQNNMLF